MSETIKLYGFWRSLATYRVRVALHLKGLSFEEISVDLLAGEQFRPEYEAVNPNHAVPTLLIDGQTLTQSLAIIEYLEETRTEVPLLPKAPAERAAVRSLSLLTIADAHPLIVPRVRRHVKETFGQNEEQVEDWARHWLRIGLDGFEARLTETPRAPFVFGATPGLADIAIASHAVGSQAFKIGLANYPKVAELFAFLSGHDAFAKARLRDPKA